MFGTADKDEMTDLDQNSAGDTSPVAILGWVVPRPTGRWHQAIAVTSQHVWITPEISFADNEAMEAAASEGSDAFHTFLKSSGWINRPERVSLSDIRGLNWNETTGWLRIGGADDHVIGAMIPDRKAGDRIKAGLKQAVAARVTSSKSI